MTRPFYYARLVVTTFAIGSDCIGIVSSFTTHHALLPGVLWVDVIACSITAGLLGWIWEPR